MKLLFENWRRFLQRKTKSWEVAGRPFVIKDTSEGPVAFYRSSGQGTPGRVLEGEWVPFGGIVFYPGRGVWFVKLPKNHPQAQGEKILKKDSEFHKIASELAGNPEDISSPQRMEDTYEGIIEVNKTLEGHGALKKDWAKAKEPGLENLFISDKVVEAYGLPRGPLPHVKE